MEPCLLSLSLPSPLLTSQTRKAELVLFLFLGLSSLSWTRPWATWPVLRAGLDMSRDRSNILRSHNPSLEMPFFLKLPIPQQLQGFVLWPVSASVSETESVTTFPSARLLTLLPRTFSKASLGSVGERSEEWSGLRTGWLIEHRR